MKNYSIKKIDRNELTSKNHKKICKNLNYIEHLLIFACVVLGFVSISAFSSLIGIPAGILSPAV